MAGSPINRRRFLGAAAAALASSLLGAAAWVFRSDGATSVAGTASTSAVRPPGTTQTMASPSSTSVPTTTAVPVTTVAPPSTTAIPASPAAELDIICKEAWGAGPVIGDFTPHVIDQITVHHTAVLLTSNRDAPARARQHQSYHQSLGWPDLAYHYLVDANGHVYQGRPVEAVGDTATDYDPTGHLLVCCEGDFDNQEIGATQLAALVGVLAWGAVEFGVDPMTIRGHRDMASTSCPGDHLYGLFDDGSLVTAVTAIVDSGAPVVNLLCGDRAVALVAAIESGTV